MTKIVLHIGGEKTGTTTLQAVMARNARMLFAQAGLLYPLNRPLSEHSAHFPIAAAFLEPVHCNFIDADWRRPAAELRLALESLIARRRPRLLVLSSEHFSSRFLPGAIAELRQFLSPYPVQVIFYVRPQDELAVSAFSSGLLSGNRKWFDADAVTPEDRYYDLCRIADDWAAVFGADSLTLRNYQDFANAGLVEDFLAQAGVVRLPLVGVSRLNEAITILEAQLLQSINQRLPNWEEALQASDERSYGAAQRMRQRLLQVLRQDAKTVNSPPVTSLIGEQQRANIMARFERSNARLVEKYGITFGRLAKSPAAQPAAPQAIEPVLIELLVAQFRQDARQQEAIEWNYRRTPEAWIKWLPRLAKRAVGRMRRL